MYPFGYGCFLNWFQMEHQPFASDWILFDLFELRLSPRSSKNLEAHRVEVCPLKTPKAAKSQEFRDGLPYRRRYA